MLMALVGCNSGAEKKTYTHITAVGREVAIYTVCTHNTMEFILKQSYRCWEKHCCTVCEPAFSCGMCHKSNHPVSVPYSFVFQCEAINFVHLNNLGQQLVNFSQLIFAPPPNFKSILSDSKKFAPTQFRPKEWPWYRLKRLRFNSD